MKKLLLAAGILVLAAFKPTSELPIGAVMPMADVQLKTVAGTEISLQKSIKQNGLLVMFSCNTCPYVIRTRSARSRFASMQSRSKWAW